MSIVVTTPTGNIGRSLTEALLQAGHKPVLIARDPSKVKAFTDRGATVLRGSHRDPGFMREATAGAEALFVLTPPDMAATDLHSAYRPYGEAAAEAIVKNGIPFVVHLSSVGADLEAGNGPIAGLHLNETLLNQAARTVVHLRPGYFMENTLAQLQSIAQAGALFTLFPPGIRIAMVATRDIGAWAAQILIKREQTGQTIKELQGPEEVTYEDVATILSEVLGRTLHHVTVGPDQLIAAMTGMGVSRAVAESFVELNQALTEGRIRFYQGRTAETLATTPYPVFAREVFKPVFEGMIKG